MEMPGEGLQQRTNSILSKSNSGPSVSVIIPVFNRSEAVKAAIDSVLQQNYQDRELIVVDDGSTDDTPQVLKKYGGEIRVIRKENQGPSAARNEGIKNSRGSWICFLDSDDLWKRSKLSRQLEVLEVNPDYRVIYTNEIWIRNGIRVNQRRVHQKYGGRIYRRCLPLCIISPSSVMMGRSVFDEVGLFDEELEVCEDYDLWLRIASRYPIYFLDENLIVKTGGRGDQLSKKYWGMDRFRVKALLKALSLDLPVVERRATCDMIIEKSRILISGFKRRDKVEELRYYEGIIKMVDFLGRGA